MKKIIYFFKLLYCVVIGTPMFLGLMGMFVFPVVALVGAFTDDKLLVEALVYLFCSVLAYYAFGFLLPDELPERPE